MMLTSDLAFTVDPDYKKFAKLYADNLGELNKDFAASWYRLTSQDMGPKARCIGEMVPPAQPFQTPLPRAPRKKPRFISVRSQIQAKLNSGALKPNDLIRLAFQCANTFRNTDYSGGCNGARIRFEPQSTWPINKGLAQVISELDSIRRGRVSLADVIVLAGNTAIEAVRGNTMELCGGRVDAVDAEFTADLGPRDFVKSATILLRDDISLKGLTLQEGVALFGRPTEQFPSLGGLFTALLGKFFTGPNADGGFAVGSIIK